MTPRHDPELQRHRNPKHEAFGMTNVVETTAVLDFEEAKLLLEISSQKADATNPTTLARDIQGLCNKYRRSEIIIALAAVTAGLAQQSDTPDTVCAAVVLAALE